MRLFFAISFFCAGILFLIFWKPSYEALHTGSVMGTSYAVKWITKGDNKTNSAIKDEIASVLHRVNDTMSTYKDTSDLSLFQQQEAKSWLKVSQETYEVTEIATELWKNTQGAFDPTVAPLVELWGFGRSEEKETPPSDEAIMQSLQKVGFHHLESRSDPTEILKNIKGLSLDYSAVAKGYAVDKVAEVFQDRGIEHFFIEVGGEIRAVGHGLSGSSWRAGIEAPQKEGRRILKILDIRDKALATSGTYRNYFESNGQSYSHTIDPRTGRPVTHNLHSVSVLHDSCAYADGYATALLVLGPEEGYRLAEKLNLAAFFVFTENGERVQKETSNFKSYVRDSQ